MSIRDLHTGATLQPLLATRLLCRLPIHRQQSAHNNKHDSSSHRERYDQHSNKQLQTITGEHNAEALTTLGQIDCTTTRTLLGSVSMRTNTNTPSTPIKNIW